MRWPGDTAATRRLPPLLGPSSPGPTAGSRNWAVGRQVDFPEVKETQVDGIGGNARLRFGPLILNEEDKRTQSTLTFPNREFLASLISEIFFT